MAGKPITLDKPRELSVAIRDPEKDADRVFHLRVMTRSAKREAAEADRAYRDLLKAYPEDEDEVTEEHEEAVIAAACALMDKLMVGPEGAPSMGDMLLTGWREDRVTDDQLFSMLNTVTSGDADPT